MTRKDTEVKRLRIMAAQINQRLSKTQRYHAESRRRYWLRSFAAAALPGAIAKTNGRADAVQSACNHAFALWFELERRIAQQETDEREESKTPE